MVTLQQIYDACTGGPECGLPATGQTGCWGMDGGPIACADTGQDGEYQKGFSVDPRFTDNGDGTVTDNLTGLIWLRNANCWSGVREWNYALSNPISLHDPQCGLTDGSVVRDWRLPNVNELYSLIDRDQSLPALPTGHPFSGVESSGYWSSTTNPELTNQAFNVSFWDGAVYSNTKYADRYIWPVRGGQ
jgi:hypothetical protein